MILYLGNNLNSGGRTPTSIETLGLFLAARYSIRRVSDKKTSVIRWIDMMYTLIRYSNRISVVLIDTYSTRAFYYALGAAFLCRVFSIPYIPILRGGNLPLRLTQSPVLSNFVFDEGNVLVAPSNYLHSIFLERGFSKTIYIPNSIKIVEYEWKERRSPRPRLLWVRAFHAVYNPQMAIEVVRKLSFFFPDAELCLVGPDKDGTLATCQELVRQQQLESRVSFTGLLSKDKWRSLSTRYDIFINTTTIDNTPVSVIEAMALGLPVVSTNVGGVPFLIEDHEHGLLVSSADVDEMVNRIKWLIENPERSYQITLAARRYVERFDWECVKQAWFSLLDPFEHPITAS